MSIQPNYDHLEGFLPAKTLDVIVFFMELKCKL
jgi:hypothetical protein